MIPRVIHYCWFGRNPKPKSVERCIDSWKRKCPDYQIVEWNEDNFDIDDSCNFVRQAYHNKKWAFVSDYARLQVVYDQGGVYLDTDVELLKSLDDLISSGLGFMGFEKPDAVASGLGFAAEKGDYIIKEMLDYYSALSFDAENPAQVKCPIINTLVLKRHGLELNNQLQLVGNLQILPDDYLCPENMYSGKKHYTENTVSVHHYDASWMSFGSALRQRAIIGIKKLLPDKVVKDIQNIYRSSKIGGVASRQLFIDYQGRQLCFLR